VRTHTWANNGPNVKRARGPLEAFPFSDAENVQVCAKWCQVIRITTKFKFPAFWNAFKPNAQFQHFIQIFGWDCLTLGNETKYLEGLKITCCQIGISK
jgi:hypothetical protein